MNLDDLISEYADIEQALADPAVHADQQKARTLGKRYAHLRPIVETFRDLRQTDDDLAAARELAAEDEAFAVEATELETRRVEFEERLHKLLVPRDPNDDKDVILEIKAGEGGEESALFAGDLLRMYQRYAERVGWKTEIIDGHASDLGGYKDVTMSVKGKAGV
ncbi:MAG: PCRF domain-containing protein, partial [Actinomadura sp.]